MSKLMISGALTLALALILAAGCSKKEEKAKPEPTPPKLSAEKPKAPPPSAGKSGPSAPVPAPTGIEPPPPEAKAAPVAKGAPAEALLGKWENREYELSFEFKADGTFLLSDGGEEESGRFSLSEEGTLVLESNDVYLDLPIELKGDALFITDMDDETVELKRVK